MAELGGSASSAVARTAGWVTFYRRRDGAVPTLLCSTSMEVLWPSGSLRSSVVDGGGAGNVEARAMRRQSRRGHLRGGNAAVAARRTRTSHHGASVLRVCRVGAGKKHGKGASTTGKSKVAVCFLSGTRRSHTSLCAFSGTR